MGEFKKGDSRFTGTMLGKFGTELWTGFITLITLFIAFPWMECERKRWYAKHTIIDGRQMQFVGNGGALFGSYIKWLLLTIITIGIYGFWLQVRLSQWITKNTYFADSNRDGNPSLFTGGVGGMLGVNIVTILGTLFTFGIALPWIHCFRERWFARHTAIEGYQKGFNGSGGALFGKYIVWFLLTIITIGIYSLWLSVNMVRWTVANTEFATD